MARLCHAPSALISGTAIDAFAEQVRVPVVPGLLLDHVLEDPPQRYRLCRPWREARRTQRKAQAPFPPCSTLPVRDRSRLGRANGRRRDCGQAGFTCLLTIQACLPTCRTRLNPWSSNNSTVPLNRNRPTAWRPVVTSEIASTRPPPAAAICSSAPPRAALAMPCPRCFLST